MSSGTSCLRAFALGLVASVLLGCPRQETPPPPAAGPRLLFKTPDEARAYILTRILAVEEAPDAGDLYAGTLFRRYTTLNGETTCLCLVGEPARELALAEGFQAHGFAREALAHYENLIAYHGGTQEGQRARERIDECRRATVLGLVEPLTVVVQDGKGDRYVAASSALGGKPAGERLQDPLLERGEGLQGPFMAVGFIDDAGGIIAEGNSPLVEDPIYRPKSERRGSLSTGRVHFRLDSGAKTLFEAERLARARLLRERAGKAPDDASRRRLAEDFLYVGCRAEAAEVLEGLNESLPPNPLDGDLAALAAQPDHPLCLDALWLLKARDNPRFALSTKSCVTMGVELPVEVDAHAIDCMTFKFARLKGPVPAEEGLVRKWLSEAEAGPSHEEALAVPPGKSTLRLPVREPGTWRVTAEARGLTCTFAAVRTDASLEAFLLPSEVMFLADRGGFSIGYGQKKLGATDDEGFTSTNSGGTVLKGRLCEEHRECCAGCESCLHHHTEGATALPAGDRGVQVFVAGQGQFFRATARFDRTGLDKVKVPAVL